MREHGLVSIGRSECDFVCLFVCLSTLEGASLYPRGTCCKYNRFVYTTLTARRLVPACLSTSSPYLLIFGKLKIMRDRPTNPWAATPSDRVVANDLKGGGVSYQIETVHSSSRAVSKKSV